VVIFAAKEDKTEKDSLASFRSLQEARGEGGGRKGERDEEWDP
jgi:hypothetical protein